MPEAHNALAGDPGALSPLKGAPGVLLDTGEWCPPHAGVLRTELPGAA